MFINYRHEWFHYCHFNFRWLTALCSAEIVFLPVWLRRVKVFVFSFYSDAYTKLLADGGLSAKYAAQFNAREADFSINLAKICFLAHLSGNYCTQTNVLNQFHGIVSLTL
jgi:hypothetical protein